jgi:hypothetical protein
MQHIGLQREDEFGNVLADFDEGRSIDLRIVLRAPSDSAVLRFIDPYGNTIINRPQLPVLIAELHGLVSAAVEADFRVNVERLVSFLEASKGDHVYVRFIGD